MSDVAPAGGRDVIAVDEAIAAVDRGAYLLDVREQGEWDAGHAPAAHFLPMSQLAERVDEIPSDREVLVVCRSGGRSAQVTAALRNRGVDAVDVLGGMSAWQNADGELTTDSGSEATVA